MKKILMYTTGIIITMVFWAIAVFLGTLNGWTYRPLTKQENSQSYIEAVEEEISKQFVGNFALALLKNGTVEHEKFHTEGKPVDSHTVFQVASLSKWVSAFGVMKLVETGQLDLDTPVSKYLTRWQLPPSKFDNEKVTVRRLLSHTAGLTDGLGYSGFEKGTPIQSIEQSLTQAADADEGTSGVVSVGLEPGSEFKYSGGGYTLLQLLVEEVTQQSFAEFMKTSILEPLGMNRSTYSWNDISVDSLSEFYNSDGTKAKHYRYTSLASTSLYTCLADLELFFQAHLEGQNSEPIGRNVLQPETILRMREPHAQQMGADVWGLGTMLYAPVGNGEFIIGHDGKNNPPINTALRLNPMTGDGIIILETGSAQLATELASDWVFWKTGKIDSLLFLLLMDNMIITIAMGWLMIVILAVAAVMLKRSRG